MTTTINPQPPIKLPHTQNSRTNHDTYTSILKDTAKKLTTNNEKNKKKKNNKPMNEADGRTLNREHNGANQGILTAGPAPTKIPHGETALYWRNYSLKENAANWVRISFRWIGTQTLEEGLLGGMVSVRHRHVRLEMHQSNINRCSGVSLRMRFFR